MGQKTDDGTERDEYEGRVDQALALSALPQHADPRIP